MLSEPLNVDSEPSSRRTDHRLAATSWLTFIAAVTGRPVLKVGAALTLVVMIVVALTHPTGAVNAWVVVAVLSFFFAVIRRTQQHAQD